MPVRTRHAVLAAMAVTTAAAHAHAQSLYARSQTVYHAYTGLDDPAWDYASYWDEFSTDEFPHIGTWTRHTGSVTYGGGMSQGVNAVGVGYIRAFTEVDGFLYNQGTLYSNTQGWFEDEITPQGPAGITFTRNLPINTTHWQGTINGGPITMGAEGLATRASIQIFVNGFPVVYEEQETYFDNWSGQNEYVVYGNIPPVILVPVTFTTGTPTKIRVQVITQVAMDSDGGQVQGKAGSYFANSVRAMGFQDLPEGVTLSGSIDWTQPAPIVPELRCLADLTGASLDGTPDGSVDAADLNYYVGLWLTADSAADLTGPGLNGLPDGQINAFDLGFYINLWLNTLGPCPNA